MTEPHSIKKFTGLFGSLNAFADIPEGACEVADNCQSRSTDILEPRRGYSAITSAAAINAIGFKQGKLLALSWDDASRGVTGQLRSYDSATQVFTSMPMTPGAQPFDRPGGTSPARTRFVSAQKATYFMSRYGLTKVEDIASAVCRSAIQPRNWVDPSRGGPFGSAGAGAVSGTNWLANGFQVAYRATLCRLGANGEVIESEPSDRFLATNNSGSAGSPRAVLSTSWMCPPDVFWRLYRSKQVANGTDPSDEMYLVTEIQNPGGVTTPEGYIRGAVAATTYTDNTPDGSLYVPLYTNAITGDTLAAADTPPPVALDMAWFKNRLLLLNTTDVQRLTIKVIGTGSTGINDGDWITINGVKFNFQASPVVAQLWANAQTYTAGTVAQNIENTARDLVAAINNYFGAGPDLTGSNSGRPDIYQGALPGAVCAFYVSATGTDAGQILLQSLLPNSPTITVKTSARSGWDRDYTAAYSSAANVQGAGLSWSKPFQPEAVPLTNATVVGDASSDGQRVIALKEAALIFKKDGLWRWTDDGVNVGVWLGDPTVRLLGPETAVAIDNVVCAMTDAGVTLFSEAGAKVNVSHDQIERELLKLVAYVGRTTFEKVAFAVAYELEHQYILCVPETPNATSCTRQYVFNLQTRAWTSWTLPGVIAGAVNPDTGQLVWAMDQYTTAPAKANNLWLERKNNDSTDYQDPGFSIASPATTATATMIFAGDLRTGSQAIAVGDVIQQAQATNFLQQRVTAVAYNSSSNQTTVTLDYAPRYAWSNAVNLTVAKAIQSRVRFLPFTAGEPITAKEWDDAFLAFRYCDVDFISVTWATELLPIGDTATERIAGLSTDTPAPPISLQTWAPPVWGNTLWGRQTRNIIIKISLPGTAVYSTQLILELAIANALARWELAAIDTKIAGVTAAVVR